MITLQACEIWGRAARLSLVLAWMGGLATVPAAQNTVVVWGSRPQTEVPADATNLASVATSSLGCVGVSRDGTLHAWGYTGGALSVTATNAFAVAMVLKPAILRRDGLVVYSSGLVSGVSNAVAVAAAQSYGAGALRQDGVFSGWDGLWSPRSGTSNIAAIAGGGYGTIDVLYSDGTVSGYGVPQAYLSSLSNVVAIAKSSIQTVWLKSDGTVAAYPLTNTPAGLSNVVAIAAGGSHLLALRNDGTVWGWGDNAYGQTIVPAGLGGVVAIAAGYAHSVGLRADGTVVVWGSNGLGQTNVPPGLSNVVAIAAGFYHTLALRSDSTVVSWGYEADVPAGLSNVVTIAAGGYGNLAIVRPGLAAAPVQIANSTRTCGGFSLEVTTRRAKTYYLQYRDSLADPRWTLLPPVPGDGTVKTLSDSQAAAPQRFYRVWQKP